MTPNDDPTMQATAHALVAKIAMTEGNAALATSEAATAEQLDPTLPMQAFIGARLLYNQGKYADALPLFEKALAAVKDRPTQVPELHFYAGDTLARLDRYSEAERQFLQELHYFPQNTKAYASLAMLYRVAGDNAASDKSIEALLTAAPLPESYATAARLWTMFGEKPRAAAVREEARRRFGASRPQH